MDNDEITDDRVEVLTFRVKLEPRHLDVQDFWAVQGPIGDAILDKLLELGVLNASVSSEVSTP